MEELKTYTNKSRRKLRKLLKFFLDKTKDEKKQAVQIASLFNLTNLSVLDLTVSLQQILCILPRNLSFQSKHVEAFNSSKIHIYMTYH